MSRSSMIRTPSDRDRGNSFCRTALPAQRNLVHFSTSHIHKDKSFLHEFAQALTLADHVILADIYAARETDTLGMSSEALSDAIRELGGDSYYFSSFDEIKNFVKEKCIHGDMLITMGAGDVVNIGESLLSI